MKKQLTTDNLSRSSRSLIGAGISMPCWVQIQNVTDSCSFCTQSGNPYAVWHIRSNVIDVIFAHNVQLPSENFVMLLTHFCKKGDSCSFCNHRFIFTLTYFHRFFLFFPAIWFEVSALSTVNIHKFIESFMRFQGRTSPSSLATGFVCWEPGTCTLSVYDACNLLNIRIYFIINNQVFKIHFLQRSIVTRSHRTTIMTHAVVHM